MSFKTLFVIIITAVTFSSCNQNEISNPFSEDKEQEIKTIVDQYKEQFQDNMEAHPIGIGLYISSDEEDLYISSGFPQEYGESIRFRAASNSKTFTAAAILKLHQEGKLSIDNFITEFIPGTEQSYIPNNDAFNIPNKSSITIKQLLQHRAGVFDVTNNRIPTEVNAPYAGRYFIDYTKEQLVENHTFTFEELVGVVAQHQLSDFLPDEDFKYSNTGYNILGAIIERVSGLALHEYLESNFFEPLALQNTTSPHLGTDNQLPNPYTLSYVKSEGNIYEIDTDNLSSAISEGQIVSTPKDLAKWAKKLYGTNEILNAETLSLMTSTIPADSLHGFYGLGTQAFPEDLGVGHDGARVAYLSSMRYIQDINTSFVIFTNHLNVDDFMTEGLALYEVIRKAKEILAQ